MSSVYRRSSAAVMNNPEDKAGMHSHATPSASEQKPSLRSRMITGLVWLVPLWITVVVAKAVFRAMGSFLSPLLTLLPWNLSPAARFAISIGAFLLLIYLIGSFASYILGRKLLQFWEAMILKIPLIRTIYSAAKQVVDAISLSNRSAFKSVVLVQFPVEGSRSLGFVTGTVRDPQNREMVTVFVPTAPNPTTGFLMMVPREQTEQTALSIETAVRMIVSGGVLSPQSLGPAQEIRANKHEKNA